MAQEVIHLKKSSMPSSSYYTGSGTFTITLNGIIEVNWNTKKTLIKINRPQTKSKRATSPSDQYDSKVVDTKRGEETVQIKGYLEDDSTETAWNKWWKLRGMCTVGGELDELKMGGITFASSATQAVFIESVTMTRRSDDTWRIQDQVGSAGKHDLASAVGRYLVGCGDVRLPD